MSLNVLPRWGGGVESGRSCCGRGSEPATLAELLLATECQAIRSALDCAGGDVP